MSYVVCMMTIEHLEKKKIKTEKIYWNNCVNTYTIYIPILLWLRMCTKFVKNSRENGNQLLWLYWCIYKQYTDGMSIFYQFIRSLKTLQPYEMTLIMRSFKSSEWCLEKKEKKKKKAFFPTSFFVLLSLLFLDCLFDVTSFIFICLRSLSIAMVLLCIYYNKYCSNK